ncbi:glutaredoxin family protein [Ramlibacter humi]|uniref:Glutaredoxin family protein n=1 Tax=Ramlibacter humi TaxID=2530451 RepID=A0A4Z0CBV0_9BURK|nr:glutaredoxin family protein [Ramlibacter humi]TFZ08504.1 glutaredoxin family protein [Ramlibacter humi]
MTLTRIPALTPARATALALALIAGAAGAQQVYRIMGPDGKVTFSDKPPADTAKAGPAPTVPVTGATAGGALPFELRQVVQRYPVTLYVGPNCGPCGSGRTLLSQRGVPFTEKTVTSNEDIAALERLTGNSPSLPVLTVGGQQLRGYSDAEWGQYLDAAGYPKSSQLPAGYRNPAPTPLVATAKPPGPAAANEPAAPAPAPGPALPAGSNPAGITF